MDQLRVGHSLCENKFKIDDYYILGDGSIKFKCYFDPYIYMILIDIAVTGMQGNTTCAHTDIITYTAHVTYVWKWCFIRVYCVYCVLCAVHMVTNFENKTSVFDMDICRSEVL